MKTILAFIGGLLAGAALLWVTGERYRVFAAGSGKVMRVDRWTGESWVQMAMSHWQPVAMTQTVTAAEAKKLRDDLELYEAMMGDVTAERDALKVERDKAIKSQFDLMEEIGQAVGGQMQRYQRLIKWYEANPNGGNMVNDDGRSAYVNPAHVNEQLARARERYAALAEIHLKW
jgi:hypothetical protein